MVICGAEPLRPEVMKDFLGYFASAGFPSTCLMPAFGLAEFTLCATAQTAGRPLRVLHVDQRKLGSEGKIVPVEEGTPGAASYVGVGSVYRDGTVCRIVDPDTREALGENRVGEVWLDGPSKANGYFGDDVKTAAVFRGVIRGEETSGHVYLQTGDQGFMRDNQLFLTGRLKDLIIIHGRNLYPQVRDRLGRASEWCLAW